MRRPDFDWRWRAAALHPPPSAAGIRRVSCRNKVRGCQEKLLGLAGFCVDAIERRYMVVPFQQRGGIAAAPDSMVVKFPDWRDDGVIVCVQNVLLKLRMSRDMNLRD